MLKLSITRFDDQEKTVARRQREVRRIEHGMIWLRQFVQRQHAEHRRESSAQNRALKRDGNESRPTVKGFTAHVEWIVNDFHPVLHKETAQPPEHTADENNQRQSCPREPDRFR